MNEPKKEMSQSMSHVNRKEIKSVSCTQKQGHGFCLQIWCEKIDTVWDASLTYVLVRNGGKMVLESCGETNRVSE